MIIKGLRGFHFILGLLPLIKHSAHQVTQVGFENAASGFVLGIQLASPDAVQQCQPAHRAMQGGSQELHFRSAFLIQIKI